MLRIETKEKTHVIEYMGAKFEVVPNSKDKANAIVKKHTFVHKVKTGPGSKDNYEERMDWLEIHADNMDTQVKSWSGIDGDIECNSENKRSLAMLKENEHICIHIQEQIAKIGTIDENEREEVAKN